MFRRPIFALLAQVLRSSAIQFNGTVDPTPSESLVSKEIDKVLLVDVRGPSRRTGDGVRVMGMLMDLHHCGHVVEVLSDAENSTVIMESWLGAVAKDAFRTVYFWDDEDKRQLQSNSTTDSMMARLETFDRIIVGGKLDIVGDFEEESSVVTSLLKILYSRRHEYQSKTVVFWDDVPFERCIIKPDAETLCPQVPDFVRYTVKIAHKFYVLSVDDKKRMMADLDDHQIDYSAVDVNVWPMRIANMQVSEPNMRYSFSSATSATSVDDRNWVVMMGNKHAVNRMMVTELFTSGAMKRICQAISDKGSAVRIMFLGGVGEMAEELASEHADWSSCVIARTDFVSDEELESGIFPKQRASLNPFFADVNSGISVKNFESIMSGVPFLTSEYGMHGLSDEIEACQGFPMPADPNSARQFSDFVIENVIDNGKYLDFAEAFAENGPKCIQGQWDMYPLSHLC